MKPLLHQMLPKLKLQLDQDEAWDVGDCIKVCGSSAWIFNKRAFVDVVIS